MEENFKQREKILDLMEKNLDARLALIESNKYIGFRERILLFLKRWF